MYSNYLNRFVMLSPHILRRQAEAISNGTMVFSPISAAQGGTAPSYTVNSPNSGSIYRLSYLSAQVVRPLEFTLVFTSGSCGILRSLICPVQPTEPRLYPLHLLRVPSRSQLLFSVGNNGTFAPTYNALCSCNTLQRITSYWLLWWYLFYRAFDGSMFLYGYI